MVKRIFNGTVKCGFCGKELTADEIEEYVPFDKRDGDLDEEQCPCCGYHSTFIEDKYEAERIAISGGLLCPATGRGVWDSVPCTMDGDELPAKI